MAYKQMGIMKLAGAFWSTYDCTFAGPLAGMGIVVLKGNVNVKKK